jgi:hypothetical protein
MLRRVFGQAALAILDALPDNLHWGSRGVFGDTTTAVLYHDRMWLGSISKDRIGVVAAKMNWIFR